VFLASYSDNHKAKALLVAHLVCSFRPPVQTGNTTTLTEAALLPSPDMQRLLHELGPQLTQLQSYTHITFSDDAVFIVSEGITKAMKNHFHTPLAPHKPHFLCSAVNLQERIELCFPKNLKKQWTFCIFQN